MEQALTKVLNEKSALQAENTALRAALELCRDTLEEIRSLQNDNTIAGQRIAQRAFFSAESARAAAGVSFWMKQMGGSTNSRHEFSDIPTCLHVRELPV